MRTTLNIDAELLFTVKEIARSRHATAGEVVSALLGFVESEFECARISEWYSAAAPGVHRVYRSWWNW